MPVKKNSGLGRGLDAIFLENTLEKEAENKENQISLLKVSLIDPKSDQPRKNFDKEALEELAESISQNGLLQPILVREYGTGRYQIIAGERRFRASKIAGLTEIPSIILDKDDRKVAEIALIENIQREDLNPIEEAMAYKALAEEYQLTQEELSMKVDSTYDVTFAVTPADADRSALSWSSTAPEVATVYNGTLTAMGPGTTKITVSFNGKALASFDVTVE